MKVNAYNAKELEPFPKYDGIRAMPGLDKKQWWFAIALAGLTVLVYLPAMQAGFVWDDNILLTDNPVIHSADGWWRVWLPGAMMDYYPVTWMTFWLEWRLWGTNATGYHVTNILLHALSAVLIWRILLRLQVRGAWLAALLFAVHPVNVESVAWVSERKNTLSLLFYALTMLAYLRFEQERDRRWYGTAVGLFLLALLSKTSGVMLPAVLLLCDWWQRGKIERKDLVRSAPFFLLAAVFGVITIWSQQMQLSPGSGGGVERPLLFRLGAAGHVFWFYLFKTLAPVRLMTEYPLWKFDKPTAWFWLPSLAVVAVVAVAWWYRAKGGRAVLFALFYFGAMLLPVSGLFNMPYVGRSPVVTDHLQYLAMIGVVGLVASVVVSFSREFVKGIVVVFVGVLCFLTWSRAASYENHERLFGDTLAKNPNATKAHLEVGNALVKRGRLDAAVFHFTEAVRLKPRFVEARCNLANTLAQLGRADEAIAHFQEAIRLRPNTAELHYNFGLALVALQRLDEAIPQFRRALELKPDFAAARANLVAAHYNHALALARRGQLDGAIAHFTEAVRLDPSNALAHNNLGIALAQQGRIAEARVHFAEAVRLDPNDPDYRRNLTQSTQNTKRP